MREFKCFDGEIVDLNDDSLYPIHQYPLDVQELRAMIFQEIGWSYWYMDFYMADAWHCKGGKEQKERVKKLISHFTVYDKESKKYGNIRWYQEFLFKFRDEIENMC
jgi:hypothetical protein